MDFVIDLMKPEDWPAVAAIYQEGIDTKIATFQDTVPAWEAWNAAHCASCRLVARSGGDIWGWVALTPISDRCVYAGVANVSVYVAGAHRGCGVGSALLNKVVALSEAEGFWSLQSGIIRENASSRALHAKCGFREVGYRERLGQMDNGKWHDVIMAERRSQTVG